MSNITLYLHPTPNAFKVGLMLHELGLSYKKQYVDITKGEQFAPDFLKISPNNRIPAIVDAEGINGQPVTLFESGAILIYLADKYQQFLSTQPHQRYQTLQWLMWGMGGVGPMFGQLNHFERYAPVTIDYAVERYLKETKRLHTVLNSQLKDNQFVSGEYSIADMNIYPWVYQINQRHDFIKDLPYVKRWLVEIDARSAVQVTKDQIGNLLFKADQKLNAEAFNNLFGHERDK